MSRKSFVQRHPRITKRLEVTFSSGGVKKKGILSNMSLSGLFIRTNSGFGPGTQLDIEILLSENIHSFLKGIVVRTIKNPLKKGENGMGISLVSQDETYTTFVHASLHKQGITAKNQEPDPEYQIYPCPECGIKNRVSIEKILVGAKCGRCGASFTINIR
jgi:hypothetical protein